MILVEICGGLGNQMFQYACGKALALRNRDTLALDLQWYDTPGRRDFQLRHFKIQYAKCMDEGLLSLRKAWVCRCWYEKLFHRNRRLREKSPGYNAKVFNGQGNLYLQGYWQTEKYFVDCKEAIAQDFSLAEKLDERNKDWADRIAASKNAVSIHIRRGDYVSIPANQQLFVELSSAYYQKSIERMQAMLGEINLFVFTNDIPWAKDNLLFDVPMAFVDANDEENGWKDMYLMSLCDHNIIANSTFSWWGAWLNKNRDKIVVAPRRWFKKDDLNHEDIIPNGWIAVPSF